MVCNAYTLRNPMALGNESAIAHHPILELRGNPPDPTQCLGQVFSIAQLLKKLLEQHAQASPKRRQSCLNHPMGLHDHDPRCRVVERWKQHTLFSARVSDNDVQHHRSRHALLDSLNELGHMEPEKNSIPSNNHSCRLLKVSC